MLKAWILALRPKTLTAALAPILLATALAKSFSHVTRLSLSFWALAASLFIQFGTNLVNDAMDFKHGTDTVRRLGPARMTQQGHLKHRQVMAMAGVFFITAFLCGLPLVYEGGIPILVIGLLSLTFAYAYTGGPYPLAYHGLGEIFVVIFFGWVAVGGLYFLLTGLYAPEAALAGTQIGFLAAALISVNNLRDIDGDRINAKRTLAVIFGKSFARRLLYFFILSPFIVGCMWWLIWNRKLAFVLPLFLLPKALRLCLALKNHEPSVIYNSFLGRAALLHLLFGALLSLGLLMAV